MQLSRAANANHMTRANEVTFVLAGVVALAKRNSDGITGACNHDVKDSIIFWHLAGQLLLTTWGNEFSPSSPINSLAAKIRSPLCHDGFAGACERR